MRKRLSVLFGMATLVFAIIGVVLLSNEKDLAKFTNNVNRGKILDDSQTGIIQTNIFDISENIYKFSDLDHDINEKVAEEGEELLYNL